MVNVMSTRRKTQQTTINTSFPSITTQKQTNPIGYTNSQTSLSSPAQMLEIDVFILHKAPS